MLIKLINFGKDFQATPPMRNHYNDAGADVYAHIESHTCDYYEDLTIEVLPHTIRKIPLGFGLELPNGFVAFVVPRSGASTTKGITTEMVPIDSGYRGEIHAIVYNANDYPIRIANGDKIAQLVIVPVVLSDFTFDDQRERGDKAFGSSGYHKFDDNKNNL